MFGVIGDIVGGGLDAVWNVAGGVGTITSSTFDTVAGFFTPNPKTQSDIAEPAGGTGLTFREVAHQAQSWLDDPAGNYELEPEPVKRAQSLASAQAQSGADWTAPWGRALDLLGGVVASTARAVNEALPTYFLRKWGLLPEERGTDQQEIPQTPTTGPDTTSPSLLQQLLGGMLQQLSGLFNIGYDSEGKQPAFPVSHEIGVSKTTMLVVAAIVGAILLVVILKSKK